MARCQSDELISLVREEGIITDKQRRRPLLASRWEGGFLFGFGACVQQNKLQSELASRFLPIGSDSLALCVGRVE